MVSLHPHPISALLVAADPRGADELRGLLSASTQADGVEIVVEQVTALTPALERLALGGVDIVLLDLFLPDSEGLVTFERASAFSPDVPFIILTDEADDRLSVAAVQAGAQDYLIRSEIRGPMLARSILYGIERHRLFAALRSLSLIDDLTGLYNRRGFGELGEQYLKLAWRAGRAITLVYLDIDQFKSINDTLGHHMGDRALQHISEILRSTFRRSDIIARLGGDEFAVLALETTGEPAEWLAQRLREGVSLHNAASSEPFRLSASVGVARAMGDQRMSLEDLLAQADAAMYREKRSKKKAAFL